MKLTFAIILAYLSVLTTAADDAAVFTVEEVFMTVVNTAPFMIETTTTHIWTQSPSITPTETIVAPTPALDPAYDTL